MNKYLYTCIIKETGTPITDVAFSRSEARAMKSIYETLYKKKCSILRYEFQTKVR